MRTTWILIANASEARLFQAIKTTRDMKLVDEFSHPASRQKVVNLITDNAGRYRNSNTSPKSRYEEATPPKEVEAERFAHKLASKLNEGRNRNLYRNIIIIAPSQFQGLLNRCCNVHVKNLITNTMDKDYTKLTAHKLLQQLDGKLLLSRVA
jgi:protein required for attachment to host cells